jgi:glutamate synthase (ferredoxin)
MYFIAKELREYMAKLGVRTISELVGRTDLLKVRDGLTDAEAEIDLSKILADMSGVDRSLQTFHAEKAFDFKLGDTKDERVLINMLSKNLKAIESENNPSKLQANGMELDITLSNTDRAFGTLLGAEITRASAEGLPADTFVVNCTGAGGQSFGAFIPSGLTLNLIGDSNDYFGKGLSGGKLIVHAPENAGYDAEENIIIGNVALYGATSGEAYIAGVAGERFCVRNSGASAVGEHGCEYMTGGCAVILGPTGKNFAAGMSGGVAYVLDEENRLYKNLNKQLVLMEKIESKNDKEKLREMIEKHVQYTGSKKGQRILDNFEEYVGKFKKIIPNDYKEMLHLTAQFEEQGMEHEQAQIEAFTKLVG